eukprot:959703-Prorocentrum_minimum.AAC.1
MLYRMVKLKRTTPASARSCHGAFLSWPRGGSLVQVHARRGVFRGRRGRGGGGPRAPAQPRVHEPRYHRPENWRSGVLRYAVGPPARSDKLKSAYAATYCITQRARVPQATCDPFLVNKTGTSAWGGHASLEDGNVFVVSRVDPSLRFVRMWSCDFHNRNADGGIGQDLVSGSMDMHVCDVRLPRRAPIPHYACRRPDLRILDDEQISTQQAGDRWRHVCVCARHAGLKRAACIHRPAPSQEDCYM